MGADWPVKKLSKLTSKITKGTTPSKNDGGFVPSGVNFIKAECVTLKGTIDESKFSFITADVHEKYKRSHLEADDILFSMAGVILGKTALVKKEYLPANTNQALGLIRPLPEKIHPRYLHYFLQQGSVFHFVNNSTSQSAQPNINLQEIGNLDITIPPLQEQSAIAHILGSLDDKIELNRQMNATLEGMAQALFKSWFVDFDPVIDNAFAAGNPIPEELADRAEVRRAALADGTANREVAKPFPAGFQHTEELGWIPEGWESTPLKECTSKIGSGATPRGGKSAYIEEGVRLVRSQNIHDSEFRWQGIVCIDDEAAQRLKGVTLCENDILINITGDSILRTCVVDPSVLPARVNQHVAILRGKDGLSTHYLQQFIVRDEYKTYLMGFDAGGSRQAITKGHLEEAKIIVPSPKVLLQFETIVDPFFDRKNANSILSRNLTKLRDTLLPKLISGELRIPDAEKLAEEALA